MLVDAPPEPDALKGDSRKQWSSWVIQAYLIAGSCRFQLQIDPMPPHTLQAHFLGVTYPAFPASIRVEHQVR